MPFALAFLYRVLSALLNERDVEVPLLLIVFDDFFAQVDFDRLDFHDDIRLLLKERPPPNPPRRAKMSSGITNENMKAIVINMTNRFVLFIYFTIRLL